MPLNREQEVCAQSRGFLKANSCLLEITTLNVSQRQHQHFVKAHEHMFASFITHSSRRGWEKPPGCVIHSLLIKQSRALTFKKNVSLGSTKLGSIHQVKLLGQRAW